MAMQLTFNAKKRACKEYLHLLLGSYRQQQLYKTYMKGVVLIYIYIYIYMYIAGSARMRLWLLIGGDCNRYCKEVRDSGLYYGTRMVAEWGRK